MRITFTMSLLELQSLLTCPMSQCMLIDGLDAVSSVAEIDRALKQLALFSRGLLRGTLCLPPYMPFSRMSFWKKFTLRERHAWFASCRDPCLSLC